MTGGDLWVVRHPAVAVRGICYGRTDVPLACTVEDASNRLQQSFPGTTRSILWSSPSSRCANVAVKLASSWRTPVRLDDRLVELDFGAWEGRTWSCIEREDGATYASWMNDWQNVSPPSGERLRDLTLRVDHWLAEQRARLSRAGSTWAPALVTHAGVIRALVVLLENVSWEDAMARDVPHLGWRRFTLAVDAQGK